ncbi:MAG TPA: hypothetical protein VN874_04915 [Myxococcales bacterium]|nr:hypothetical protein [Myxococcales bacterium]
MTKAAGRGGGRTRAARLVFLVVLGGGLALWAHRRAPRDLLLDLDLTAVQPGDLAEVDVTVTLEGRALARRVERYGAAGAPGTLHLAVRGRPGPAEVDTTVVDRAGRARRSRARADLDGAHPATVAIRP